MTLIFIFLFWFVLSVFADDNSVKNNQKTTPETPVNPINTLDTSTPININTYCKCICDDLKNTTVFNINNCKDCTRVYCQYWVCKSILDVELIQAVCFESKSLKDLVVIYSFLLITLLMLFYIVFKTLFKYFKQKLIRTPVNDYIELN